MSRNTYHVAVQGCCHGDLISIYDACAQHERETGKKIDLLICCGDFQSIRDAGDLDSMAVPEKHRKLGDFHHYYQPPTPPGTTARPLSRTAPYLTLFVGGNHENSDWLAEESYGGFMAPNIYYLGHSGVVEVDETITVAGLSGIFKAMDYHRPYPPRPYHCDEGRKRSAYHVRQVEVEKLQAFLTVVAEDHRRAATGEGGAEAPRRAAAAPLVDLFVSHDWPVGITKYGDEAQLLKYKPYFADDIRHSALGNPHTMDLLRRAQPRYWLAAHLHCFFQATVPCQHSTTFLALDKCAKGKGFLDFIDISLPAGHQYERGSTAAAAGPGWERVRRHPRWVQVLGTSHTFVARNECARDGSGSGFSAAAAAQGVLSAGADPIEAAKRVSAASAAASTAAFLSEMKLAPATPLQVVQSQPTPTATPATARAQAGARQRWAPLPQAVQVSTGSGGGGEGALSWTEDVG